MVEMKFFIKISNLIENNTSINVNEDEKVSREKYIRCRGCESIIGINIVVIKEIKKIESEIKSEDEKSITNFSEGGENNLPQLKTLEEIIENIYFIKKKVSIKSEKIIHVGLIGLKLEKLEKVENCLKNLHNEIFYNNEEKETLPNLKFYILRQTKESLQNPKTFLKDVQSNETLDFLFIIHKVEGRLFLLGRNGFYNKVCETFSSILNKNIFFILSFKNIFKENENQNCFNAIDCDQTNTKSEFTGTLDIDPYNFDPTLPSQFQAESINNLINKGDQQELSTFRDAKKILCFDDDRFDEDIQRRRLYFEKLLYRKFMVQENTILTENINKIENIPSNNVEEKNIFSSLSYEEIILFQQLIKKVTSKLTDGHGHIFKCDIL
jgi:hypothetical protein